MTLIAKGTEIRDADRRLVAVVDQDAWRGQPTGHLQLRLADGSVPPRGWPFPPAVIAFLRAIG